MAQQGSKSKSTSAGGWIASGHPGVTEAAAHILRIGGNAFDAVVTAGFCSSLAEPALTSLGGGGFLLARDSGGDCRVYDFFVENPGQDAPTDASFSRFTPVTIAFDGADQDFNIGKGSVGTPGVLKGLLQIHEKRGRLPLAEVIAPAIDMAENGVILTDVQAYTLRLLGPILTSTDEGKDLYAPSGTLLKEGERMYNPQQADFLRNMPDSAISFYEGEIAKATAAYISLDGGLLTTTDLRSYVVKERSPLIHGYRSHQIVTNPQPSFGGPLLGVSLQLLEEQGAICDSFLSASHMRRLASALMETEHKREAGELQAILSFDESNETTGRQFTRGTTHVTIADSDGNIASMTTSNGEGSGHFAPGTGIMLNNMLGEDDLHPDGFHSAPPGCRVASMMTPCIVLNAEQEPMLALGSGGSKRIRSAVFQVLTHVIDYGATIEEAILAPRVHWEGGPLQVEGGLSHEVNEALKEMTQTQVWPNKNLYFGGVHTVRVGQGAAGDPRRGGSAQTVELLNQKD